jgi:hypothetical protein
MINVQRAQEFFSCLHVVNELTLRDSIWIEDAVSEFKSERNDLI